MASDESNHGEFVEAWWREAAASLPPEQMIALFEHAIRALWKRAHVTLGEVTLAAVVDRVLYTAVENYSLLSSLRVDESGICFDEFRQGGVEHQEHLPDAVLFVLVEFLTVLGHLTDEILTPALHAELSKVRLEKPKPKGGDDKGVHKIKGAKS